MASDTDALQQTSLLNKKRLRNFHPEPLGIISRKLLWSWWRCSFFGFSLSPFGLSLALAALRSYRRATALRRWLTVNTLRSFFLAAGFTCGSSTTWRSHRLTKFRRRTSVTLPVFTSAGRRRRAEPLTLRFPVTPLWRILPCLTLPRAWLLA